MGRRCAIRLLGSARNWPAGVKVIVTILERSKNHFEEIAVFSTRELADEFMHKRMGIWVIVETEVDNEVSRATGHESRATGV